MLSIFPKTLYCWGYQRFLRLCLFSVFLLSPVLSPISSASVWDAVSTSWLVFHCVRGLSFSCLPAVLGCCVRLTSVFLLSSFSCLRSCIPAVSQLAWDAVSASPGLSFSCPKLLFFSQSPVLSPTLSPTWSGVWIL